MQKKKAAALSLTGFATMAIFAWTTTLFAGDAGPRITLGLTRGDADKYNVEFQKYDRMIPVYTKNGIRTALLEVNPLYRQDATEEQLLASLKRFHVVHLNTTDEGVSRFDEKHKARAAVVGRVLARYVEEGGGLFLQPQSVRYPGDEDELYWNAVLAPLGAKILHEGAFDKTRVFEGKTLYAHVATTFWFTRNIQSHPVTEGVQSLYLPLHAFGPRPGIAAMQYSPDWQILVRGEKEAKSFASDVNNEIKLDAAGTYAEAPPVLAVRALGKGRIVCYPISTLFTGMNHRNPLWSEIVETNGDRITRQPSHSMKMQMNAYKWLAEPACALAGFGTYVFEPYKPIQFPASVDWDKIQFAKTPGTNDEFTYPDGQKAMVSAATTGIRGLVGAHSSHSDGQGSVADYVKAAKATGLSFLVFADPLEKLTPATLEKLKADCAEASKAGDFYACPGVEFSDGIGTRWAFWGEKIVWPEASFKSGKFSHVQWDGQKVNHYGKYAVACQFPGSAVLDYKQLRANGAHPENLWWFWHYLPFVYEKDRLIADNVQEYLFGLRDMRWAAVAAFTRIRAPGDVAVAAGTCFTGMKDIPSAKAALNTRCAAYWAGTSAGQYASQGPVIAAWQAINSQMENNWRYTRGAQRVRLRFVVRSEAGIAEVKVLDADRGPIRRFLGRGEKELAREFELVHDQQHYLTLDVIDKAGKRAISQYALVFCYKAGLFRCGDNLNILGPTAMCWHPDRNEFFNAAKDFRNGQDYCLRGWDTASASLGVPAPSASLWDMVCIKGVKGDGGWYPHRYTLGAITGRLMDVGINNYNIQIATMRMTKLSESFDNEKRPTPAMATIARDVGDLEFFERTHTIYAPMERVDMYITWNYRRGREGTKDYQGGIIWHEGEYRFKKDVTLQGDLPIPLLWERCPTDLEKNIGTVAVITDADGSTRVAMLQDPKEPVRLKGRLRPGGYAAWMTTPVGYHAFLAPADMQFTYTAQLPGWGGLKVGMGENGQVVKAGTVMRYRFGIATFADPKAGNDLLEHTVKAMNLGGGQAGYPVEMKAGTVKDAVFFFTAAATNNETLFTLGPQSLIIDLPVRVQGLENNGCAAIHSTKSPWFRFIHVDTNGTAWLTEPIDQKNEMWVGNVFVCDNKDVKLTLVVDGQGKGKKPFLEAHNPTDKPVKATIVSPPHTPLFGGISSPVEIPAGDSVRLNIEGKALVVR
ncbi:MAG: hypothetical protein L6437_03240 [Kiritimatiellae bacterium]|nr:hypothetical protein [Kiritimatiellia bacterium]